MIPIPSFNPLDTIKYPDGNGVINVGAADSNSKVLLYNETQANLDIDFYNGNQSILHAWEARYWTLDGDTKQLGWSINSELQMSNPPISLVIGELYGSSEKVEGSYPAPIIRQTSTGNPGGVQASVTQLVNTGNAANANVVTVNSTSAAGSTVTLSNDGLFQLLVTIAGALVNVIKSQEIEPVLQLGALTHLVEVLGNLKVDGTLESVGALTVDNALKTNTIRDNTSGVDLIDLAPTSITLNQNPIIPNAVAIQAKDSGGTAQNAFMADASNYPGIRGFSQHDEVRMWDHLGNLNAWFNTGGGGVNAGTFQAPKIQLTSGRIARFDKANFTAPAGSYPNTFTFTHGLGYVPDFIWVQPGQNVAAVGSCTTGVWNWNSTTFNVTLGAQINFQAFFIKLDP